MSGMKRTRVIFKTLVVCLIMSMFSGCWDKMEVEESAFVAVIGLDLLEKNKLEVTYRISNPQGGGFTGVLGSTTTEPAEETVTIAGSDILSARDLLEAAVTRQVTFSHNKTLIISEELAKSDMFPAAIEAITRDRQTRRDMFMIISKEKASEFIQDNKPMLETRPHKFYEFMSERWKETALVPISNIHRFIQRTEGKAGLFLAIYGTTKKGEPKTEGFEDEYIAGEINKRGGNPIQIIGSAVFKDSKMIGVLTGEETRISHILRPDFEIASILTTIPDPIEGEYRISGRIAKEKNTKVRIDINSPILKIDVTVPILFDILAVPSGVDYIEDLDKQSFLENHIARLLSKKAEALIKKTQEEFGSEPFLWSSVSRKKFGTWDEYERFNWREKYPKAQISVKFEVRIRRVGKQASPIIPIQRGK